MTKALLSIRRSRHWRCNALNSVPQRSASSRVSASCVPSGCGRSAADWLRPPGTRQIPQCAHLLRPIQCRAPFGDSHRPPAGQRLAEHPHRAFSPAEVVGVVLLRRPKAYWELLADFRHELLAHLVHAHHRMPRVVRPPVYLKHPLHAGHERVALLLRDTPHFPPPWFQFVFFNACRTVSSPIGSTTSSRTSSSASSFTVHRTRPSGGTEQAT